MAEKLGVMYSIIYDRLKEFVGRAKIIDRKDLFCIFGKVYHIPKNLRHKVMNELIKFKMLKWIDKGKTLEVID